MNLLPASLMVLVVPCCQAHISSRQFHYKLLLSQSKNDFTMAAAAVQVPITNNITDTPYQPQVQEASSVPLTARKHDVDTKLNFHKDNEDGSPPKPTYVDLPETYERPTVTHAVTVKDIRGEEDKYSLDVNGFQVHKHVSTEKDFLDDEQIKTQYYSEVEQLLKDV